MRRHLLLLYTLLVLSGSCLGQQQATAITSAGATISVPTSIFKTNDMELEEIEVSTNNGGSVVIDPKGNKSSKGGAQAKGLGGPAEFSVSSPPGYTYNITLPKKPVHENDSSSHLLNISNFTSDPPIDELNIGSQKFSIGATINVEPAQEEGSYKVEVPFDVTIGYN